MATLAGALTLADWAARVDAQNRSAISTIVELLSLTNRVLDDMLMVEANLPTGHKSTIRTGLPSATWRLLNYGVPISKSTTAPVVDSLGQLSAESQIDVDLAELNGNSASFRMTENQAFIEAMSQTMATTLWYGNTQTNPERFMGLAPRYNNTNSSATGANVLDAGGTGSDNASIWIVTWGPNATFGIFPKGKPTGLVHEDMGKWRVNDANANPYWAYVDNYKWNLGLVVRDWRYNVRIANIDLSDLSTTSAANLINLLKRAVYRLPTSAAGVAAVQSMGAQGAPQTGLQGRTVIYMNRAVASFLDIQSGSLANQALTYMEWQGRPALSFRGIPVAISDALLNTESRVT